MNVLIFSTFHLAPHFAAINLEFIQKNISEGNSVFLIDCQSSFESCGFNPYKLKYMCEICKYRENRGLGLINGKIIRNSLSEIIESKHKNAAEVFVEQLDKIAKNITYESFEVGEAVHSSYISKTRQREFNTETDQEILQRHANNSIQIYEALKDFIQENKISKIGLFNGRWDYYRAALAAARSQNIIVEVYENFRNGGYMEIFGDNLPHNIKNKNRLIEEHWENSTDGNKYDIADNFFLKKRQGHAVADKSYTQDQKKGKLPTNLDKRKKTFVLYNSSDDEFAAVGKQFENPYFKDQLEGILYVINYFRQKSDYQLVLRMHPNLKGLKRDYLDPLYELENRYSNIILIKPQDDIDTYGLMERADTVIAFGSTIGMEASYWGKPVISLGRSFYFYTGLTYTPKDREDIINLLESDLDPLDKLPAQKNAYYLMTGGHKAKYYFRDENKKAYFKNTNLNELPYWFKVYYKILKLLKIKN